MVYWEYNEKLERGTDSPKEKLSLEENTVRDITGWRTITITICNGIIASESHN